jgi:hypothetical protein
VITARYAATAGTVDGDADAAAAVDVATVASCINIKRRVAVAAVPGHQRRCKGGNVTVSTLENCSAWYVQIKIAYREIW